MEFYNVYLFNKENAKEAFEKTPLLDFVSEIKQDMYPELGEYVPDSYTELIRNSEKQMVVVGQWLADHPEITTLADITHDQWIDSDDQCISLFRYWVRYILQDNSIEFTVGEAQVEYNSVLLENLFHAISQVKDSIDDIEATDIMQPNYEWLIMIDEDDYTQGYNTGDQPHESYIDVAGMPTRFADYRKLSDVVSLTEDEYSSVVGILGDMEPYDDMIEGLQYVCTHAQEGNMELLVIVE